MAVETIGRRGALPVSCAAALAVAACSRGAVVAPCDQDLRGVYVSGGERWMVLDDGPTLEAYPLFPDGAAPAPEVAGSGSGSGPPAPGTEAELVAAPRVIDLARGSGGAPVGTLRKRYMRRAEICEARVPVHVTRCAGGALELVLADPAPPIRFSPCAWPGPGPSRVVRWRRE